MSRQLIVGIDPGLSGALAILDHDDVLLLEDLLTVQFSDARIKDRCADQAPSGWSRADRNAQAVCGGCAAGH